MALGAGAFFFGLGPFAGPQHDDMSKQQSQQITAQFQHAVAEFPLVNLSDPHERAKAQAALNIPAPEAQKILQAADSGQIQLAWVSVWDNCAEDGDVLQVSSQGYSTKVNLMHAPVTVVIPVTHGSSINLTGAIDGGGGGITAGIKTAAGEILIPPLSPGQTVTLPVK